MSVQAWAVTDVGRKRKHNEDTSLVDERLGLYAVADGMGGHAAGEVAATRCMEVLRETIRAKRELLDTYADSPTQEHAEAVLALITTAIQNASAEIARLAEEDPTRRGMGTTVVALLACGSKGIVAHVGDSRAYVVRGGRTHQLTEDHSLVEEHIKRGLMTRAEAEKSDIRNVITRAVGVQESVEVDTLVTDIVPGDVFLLCSDGLHGYFRDSEEITDLLANTPTSDAAQAFVDLANTRGGKDNITALVISSEEGEAYPEVTNVDRTVDILKKIPLFQYMNYKELLAILAITRRRQYGPGEIIVREGEAGDEFFVLLRGEVEVRKGDAFFASLATGGHFGEMALIDQAPRSATVKTVEPTHVLVIARDGLMKLMRKDSMLSVKLLWAFSLVLSERLRQTNETVISLRSELDRIRASSVHATQPDRPIVRLPFGGQW
jgi:serine/threonine protein phosphatase PrpC/CRP-like cAMP-binding protein